MSRDMDPMSERQLTYDMVAAAKAQLSKHSDAILCSDAVWEALLKSVEPIDPTRAVSVFHGLKVIVDPGREGWAFADWDPQTKSYVARAT